MDFIDIIFAIIVGMGFTFFIDYLKIFSLTTTNIIVFFLFLTTYFFIISDWIFYHELMDKYPYTKNYTRFFIDIIVFFLMFLLTYSAFISINTKLLVFYVANVAVWHLSVIAWHISAIKEYQNMKQKIVESIKAHTIRFVWYTLIGISYFIASQFIANEIVTYSTVAVIVMISIWFFNLRRLNYFKTQTPQNYRV
ncbi:MAG: hypothetical protein Q7U60_11325 [Candidatus Methanoperedens sp.]|nr:hypothetical protein [Candidatus Methanoperedens sp.]